MEQDLYKLAWSQLPGVGPKRFAAILNAFDGDFKGAWLTPESYWREVRLPASIISARTPAVLEEAKKLFSWQTNNQHILMLGQADYPSQLAEIDDAPPVLFVKGKKKILCAAQLAIVGTRHPSFYGRDVARDFATALSKNGYVITSGLALGIDAASHEGALAASNPTIAVLGTGVDHIYPTRHGRLAQEIMEEGALVSEFPPQTGVKREHFPRRNRIISGLSLGVLVVEAAPKSGSLITAHQALTQNREVFAIPGSIHNPRSKGTHALIRQGAKLVESVSDILDEFPQKGQKTSNMVTLNLPSAGKSSYTEIKGVMNDDVTSLEELIVRTGKPAHIIAALLGEMECGGVVRAVPGGYTLTMEA